MPQATSSVGAADQEIMHNRVISQDGANSKGFEFAPSCEMRRELGNRKNMPVIHDIPIELNVNDIIASHSRKPIRAGLLNDAQESLTLGQSLWQPLAIYDRFEVREITGECVRLALLPGSDEDTSLQIGPKAHLLQEAEEVLICVGTLGPALETEVHRLQAAGDNLRSYFLDSAGVVALGAVGETLRCLAEEVAVERGWGVSAALSPGSLVGWPLKGQKDLCALLPLDQIGVRLNGHHVLEPHKSFSSLIGIGPGYDSAKVGSVCKYCALKNTCWRRREDSE